MNAVVVVLIFIWDIVRCVKMATIMSYMELPEIPLDKWCSDQNPQSWEIGHCRFWLRKDGGRDNGSFAATPMTTLVLCGTEQGSTEKKQNSGIANKKLQKWKAKKAWHKLGTWTHDGFTDSYILKQKQSNNRNKQKFIMFAPLVRLYFRLVFTFCPVSSQFCALCWEKTTTLASTPSLLDSARAVETACIHHFSSSFIQIRTQLGDYTPLHGSASGIL